MGTEKLKPSICQVCGGNLRDYGTYLKCKCCDTEYQVRESPSLAEQDAYFRKQEAFSAAERNLSKNSPDFDEAESQFELLIRDYPDWSAGYWGLVRAKFGIKLEHDADGRAVPSCYKSEYNDLRGTDEYKKAIRLAETPELRENYIKIAAYIADVAREWYEKTKNIDYDIFICHKSSEDGGADTEDKAEMRELYFDLLKKGYKVFFSPESLQGGEKYEPYIYNALDKAQVLIVYGSKKEYFTETWVQNEWMRYRRAMDKKRKLQGSLIVLYKGFNPKELPLGLRDIQALDYSKRPNYNDLIKAIENVLDAVRQVRRPPVLERTSITIEKTARRNETVGESIGTVELGSAVASKKASGARLSVNMREVGKGARLRKSTQSDDFGTALTCLREGYFDTARDFMDVCLREDEKNGDVWLAELCLRLRDASLYDLIKGNGDIGASKGAIVENIDILQNAIEYAVDKQTAERLLFFVYTRIEQLLSASEFSARDAETVSKLYLLCGDYASENVERIRKLLCIKSERLVEHEQTDALDFLVSHIADAAERAALLLVIVRDSLHYCYFSLAERYNTQLKDLNGQDRETLINDFCIANEAAPSELSKIRELDLSPLESGLELVSKADAESVLKLLCKWEKDFLKAYSSFRVAERYFSFIVRYDFTDRDKFIREHVPYFANMAMVSSRSFFESVLAVHPDRSTDFHVKCRCDYADVELSNGHFPEAKAMYDSALALDAGCNRALKGSLCVRMNWTGSGDDVRIRDIDWSGWDKEAFEKVLQTSSSEAEQAKFVSRMSDLCLMYMRAQAGAQGD